eukprot:4399045-Pyramimonas_sp.AAC.1
MATQRTQEASETDELSFPPKLISHSASVLSKALESATQQHVLAIGVDAEGGAGSHSRSSTTDEAIEACSKRETHTNPHK